MWIVVFFDLPTDTKKAKRQYTTFRKDLLKDGFAMMQYSVYYRHCPSKENTEVHLERVRRSVPADGEVRVVQFTDKQFSRMEIFVGKRRKKAENAPAQLEMF
jgi:CRISPR-associated protein Cas2